MIADLKQNIDLVDVAQVSGVELRRSGPRYVGLCPFHSEKTPSFYVFDDNRFKCFGCQESVDIIDFTQKLNGLSFGKALKFLGISHGRITPEMQRRIEQQKRKAKLIKRFRKWESRYLGWLGMMINRTEKLMKSITPEDLDL
jgi:DNA primase